MSKTLNTRIQLKHDTEANWNKAVNFSPLMSELIIYDVDANNFVPRFKVGDGITNVNSLPFVTAEAAQRAIDDFIIENSTSTNLPTSAAVASFVESKGYTDNVGTITGIKMNGDLKGTSGEVDLGTVITDVSNKADKSATVSDIIYDSIDKKIIKTINGFITDVITTDTLKTAMDLDNVENKSSATIRSEITSGNVTSALGFTPLDASLKGANNGVAELDDHGLVLSSQLPSYVDDVLEYSTTSDFPAEGENGKIYVATETNLTYRWTGSDYVEISPSIALGETSSTAYRGDRGAAAYAHAVTNKGEAFTTGLYKIGTNEEGHVITAKAVVKNDITALGIPAQDTTYSVVTTTADGLMSAQDKQILEELDSNVENLTTRVGSLESTGGEPNIIESISVNNSAVTPDSNRNVALTVPTKTSDITNDGEGASPFATVSQVESVEEHVKKAEDKISTLENTPIYGFHIDSSISDPYECVTYVADAIGMTPAHMDYTSNTFDYGDWENAFFMPKPCMLKYDGTVDYYLDPNNYNLKADGTASEVADINYEGNAMIEWGRDGKKIWYKIVPEEDDNTSATIYIAAYQADEDYRAWSFINNQGDMVEHFYTPIYNGSIDAAGRLRSISGIAGTAICKYETAASERTAARLNNSALEIWDTEVWCDNVLITLLLYLIGKSLDLQTVFGKGLSVGGSEESNNGFITGVHNDNGLFYGTDSGDSTIYFNAVKAFGMENWWGFQWRRFAGLANVMGTARYKMTKGTQDGSAVEDYVVSSNSEDFKGYLVGPALPDLEHSTSSYIRAQTFNGDCMIPTVATGGSGTTYYCDILFTNNDKTEHACRGGASSSTTNAGFQCGASLTMNTEYTYKRFSVGANVSCKPILPVLPISHGGTGANNASDARVNLGIMPATAEQIIAITE